MTDAAHFTDTVGFQLPGTAWGAVDFDNEVFNDTALNVSRPDNSTFEIDSAVSAGECKVFMVNIRWKTDRNNRGVAQGRLVQTGGTGAVLWSTYETSYARNNNNDEGWTRVFGVIQACAANDQFQVQWRRDTDGITFVTDGGTQPNVTDCQIFDLPYAAIGLYRDTVGGQSMNGTTTRTTLTLDDILAETDTAKIELSGNTVLMKTDDATYLILGSFAGQTGGSRTTRNACFAYDGTPDLATEGNCYQRNAGNEYAGICLHDLYRKAAGANVSVEIQANLGVTGTAGDTGSTVAGSFQTTANFGGIAVIELHSDAEGVRCHDGTGGQTISGVASVNINACRNEDFIDASYDGRTNTTVNANGAHRALVMSSLMTGRQSTVSTVRGTMGVGITIGGTRQTVGEHGNYSRGVQGGQDCFGWGAKPGALFDLSDNDSLGVQTFDAGDNGGVDQTNPGSVSFWALNLDTLEEPAVGGGFEPAWANQANTMMGAC